MPRATLPNGLELEYESFGDPARPPLLLVMGLSYQMIEWDDALCALIADRGFWVTRFDNRDIGLSSKLDELGPPDLLAVMSGTAAPPYTLSEMAEDSVALLDALAIDAAHIVGVSMGGMIAQLIATGHPKRALSLTSIMSTVGGPNVVQPQPALSAALVASPGRTRAERVERSVDNRRLLFKAERAVDRCFSPDGAARQLAAIIAAPDRTAALGLLTMPIVVIHGDEDPLIPPGNGRQTAAAIPGARLIMIPGMGHALPEQVWPQVVDAISEVVSRSPSG